MIVDINDNLIETDEIVNVTPIYDMPGDGGMIECFKINLPASFVLIKGGNLKEKRDDLIDSWTNGEGAKKI